MFGDPMDPQLLPQDVVVLRPHWQYAVKRSGTRRSRLCCNGSKSSAPQLHAVASTWSSCVELPIQRLFLALCAKHGLSIYGADVTDAYAHSPAPDTATYLTIDDAYSEWYLKRFGKVLNKRWVLPIRHSLQGHPESGKMWMRMIDQVLIKEMGFKSTTHDRCIYHNVIDGELVLLMRQVDDFMIACTKESLAKNLTNIIGTKIRFETEKDRGEIPIEFLGLVDDYNGVDINQTNQYVEMSAQRYIGRFLTSHGWDEASDSEKANDMKSSRPISPLPTDCVKHLFKDVGPRENTPEFHALERTSGFSYRTVLGEMMYAYITCRPDIGYAITTLSKFSSSPSAYHYSKLKGLAKYLRSTIDWGIRYKRPKLLTHLKDGTEYNIKDGDQVFPVDINEPILKCFVDASHGSDPRKMRSITGLVCTYCGGAIVYRSKTQELSAGSSTEAEFIGAYTAGKVVRYLRNVLQQLGFRQKKPTPIYIDNEPALKIINENTAPTNRTRHMAIRFFALQDWVSVDKSIFMIHIPGILNPSDDLTKSLGWVLHARHCRRHMGHYN